MIARWTTVDKWAEHPDQIDKSPYAYVVGNPIRYNDPDGNCGPCIVPIIWAVEAIAEYVTVEAVTATVVAVGSTAIIMNTAHHLANDRPVMTRDNIPSIPVPQQPAIIQSSSNQKDLGSIYKVPGSATKSGKPYIGRHNQPHPQKTRKSNDGRDRKQAEVIDTYDTGKPAEGRQKEQQAIDDNGGVGNLDNKRNEVKKDPPPKTDPPKTDPPNNGN